MKLGYLCNSLFYEGCAVDDDVLQALKNNAILHTFINGKCIYANPVGNVVLYFCVICLSDADSTQVAPQAVLPVASSSLINEASNSALDTSFMNFQNVSVVDPNTSIIRSATSK
jgi:hypothetical protein